MCICLAKLIMAADILAVQDSVMLTGVAYWQAANLAICSRETTDHLHLIVFQWTQTVSINIGSFVVIITKCGIMMHLPSPSAYHIKQVHTPAITTQHNECIGMISIKISCCCMLFSAEAVVQLQRSECCNHEHFSTIFPYICVDSE